MTKNQEIILNILKALDAICRRHDIEYFATGGTALGAIRHGGFIPWDDDVDLGMTRPMWDRFKEVVNDELPEGLVMVDRFGYPDYLNPIARIFDARTTSIHRRALADGCPKGQFIEIFLHDPVPADRLPQHKRAFLLFCELLTPYQAVFYEKYCFKKGVKDDELEILKEYYKLKEQVAERGLDPVLDELEKEFSEFDRSESDYLLLDWGTNTLYYPIENFDGIRYEKFEDMEVPVPKRACDNLRIDYGNRWMYLPPAHQRRSHPGVLDNDVPWTVYMDIINQRIDPEETRRMRLSQKEIQLKALPERVNRDKAAFDIKMRFAQALDLETGGLAEMYKNGEYRAIAERFKGYIDLKKTVGAYTYSKDIRPERRQLIASALLMEGMTDEAECVLGMDRSDRLTGEDSSIVSDIIRLREAGTLYFDGLYDEAANMLSGVSEEMRHSLPYRMSATRLATVRGEYAADAEALRKEHPDDLEIAKIYADALMLKGGSAEAERIYSLVASESNNGMDVIDIKKKAGRK